jgi:hypothetical protein
VKLMARGWRTRSSQSKNICTHCCCASVQPLLLLQLMRRLDCVVQKYAWGKRGGSSKVAQLKQCESSDYEVSTSYKTRFVELCLLVVVTTVAALRGVRYSLSSFLTTQSVSIFTSEIARTIILETEHVRCMCCSAVCYVCK